MYTALAYIVALALFIAQNGFPLFPPKPPPAPPPVSSEVPPEQNTLLGYNWPNSIMPPATAVDVTPKTQEELSAMFEEYVGPIGMAWMLGDWSEPMALSADRLVAFYYWNVVSLAPENIEFQTGEFRDVPAETVEAYIQRYFDVPAEYLRTSEWSPFISDTACYRFYLGGGGGGIPGLRGVYRDGNSLFFTLSYNPLTNPVDHLYPKLLEMELLGDGNWRYTSCATVE